MRGSGTIRPLVVLDCTFQMYLLDRLPKAVLFALEVGDAGVLELEPVLFVALQGQSLGPGSKTPDNSWWVPHGGTRSNTSVAK